MNGVMGHFSLFLNFNLIHKRLAVSTLFMHLCFFMQEMDLFFPPPYMRWFKLCEQIFICIFVCMSCFSESGVTVIDHLLSGSVSSELLKTVSIA